MGRVATFLLGGHNDHFHAVHHIFPRVPSWNLRRAHAIMMSDPEYRDAQVHEAGLLTPIIPGVPTIMEGMLKHCSKKSQRS